MQHFNIKKLFYSPELFNLCTDFEKLTNASRSKTPSECEEVTVQENIGPQQRDLRDLGALLNVLLNEGDARRPIDSSAADFISLCQSAKVVEQLLDHNYLVKSEPFMTFLGLFDIFQFKILDNCLVTHRISIRWWKILPT